MMQYAEDDRCYLGARALVLIFAIHNLMLGEGVLGKENPFCLEILPGPSMAPKRGGRGSHAVFYLPIKRTAFKLSAIAFSAP